MRIYCVQLDIVWEDKRANHAKVRALLEAARPVPGSLVLLPEMFATGFSMNVASVADDASREDHDFITALAKELSIYLVAGVVMKADQSRGHNQAIVIDPRGHEIARYTKLHGFTPGKESQHYVPGREIVLFDWNGVRVCPFICYDLRFPEIFRRATKMGAEMFALIANWPSMREDHWVTLSRSRAIENQAYVAATNRCGNDPWLPYPGRSLIADPHGKVLVDAGGGEGVISAEVDVELVRSWRRDFPILADMRSDFV